MFPSHDLKTTTPGNEYPMINGILCSEDDEVLMLDGVYYTPGESPIASWDTITDGLSSPLVWAVPGLRRAATAGSGFPMRCLPSTPTRCLSEEPEALAITPILPPMNVSETFLTQGMIFVNGTYPPKYGSPPGMSFRTVRGMPQTA